MYTYNVFCIYKLFNIFFSLQIKPSPWRSALGTGSSAAPRHGQHFWLRASLGTSSYQVALSLSRH